MALKLGYRDGGKTSEEGINRLSGRLITSAGVMHDTDLQVLATGTPDNKVNVQTGDIAIGTNSPNTADPEYYYHGWNTAAVALTVSANASGNPRLDVVVAYVDLSVVSSASNDNPGALAVKIVAGTAAATPVAPDDTAIQTSVGASNPWLPLALVAVANGFSSIAQASITDLRPVCSTIGRLADQAMRDFVGAGLLWSQSSGLIGQVTTGFAIIDGETVNKSYLKKTFTASKDTYIDLPKTSKPTSTDDFTYTAVTNGAASPALASGSVRLAKVVTNGSAITSVTTSGDDTLGNPIRLTKPQMTHTHADNSNGGLLGNNALSTAAAPVQRYLDGQFDYIPAGGCVWTGDAYASTRLASMTAGVVYINGVRLTVAAVTGRTFTASRDTYVYLTDNGDGTAAFTYSEVTNNNASPAAPANSVLCGIIVTGASNIAAVGSINQGQEDKVLPIASSQPYMITDSNGVLICPRDPTRQILGYRQITSAVTTTSTSFANITGLACPVIVPSNGRKIEVEARFPRASGNSSPLGVYLDVADSSTEIGSGGATTPGSGYSMWNFMANRKAYTASSGAHTFNARNKVDANTGTFTVSATEPGYIIVRQT